MSQSFVAPVHVRSLRDTAQILGISLKTLRKLIDVGKGPKVTRISERCLGVRDDHRQEFMDSCAEQRAA